MTAPFIMNPSTGKFVSLSTSTTSTPISDKPLKPNITLNKATLPGYVAQPISTNVSANRGNVTHSIINVSIIFKRDQKNIILYLNIFH